jgi:hypothetical protein
MKTENRSMRWLPVTAVMLVPALLLAQWQVNRQVYRGGVQSTSPGAVRYSTSLLANSSQALPSQVRYSAFTSGALPSELKMNYNAIGPLAPSGAMAYIPPAPNYRTSRPVAGNYLGVQPGATVSSPSLSTSFTSAGWGSVKYSPARSITPAPLPSPGMTSYPAASPFSGIQSSSLSNSAMMGSIKYNK